VDLRQYFKSIRDAEASLTDEFPLMKSLAAPDGGKPGTFSEVSREAAAKMLVEGRAVLATGDEKKAYLEQQAARKKAAERAELARRVQVAIISEPEPEPEVKSEVKSEPSRADEKANPPATSRK
jgi:hypothetical protein